MLKTVIIAAALLALVLDSTSMAQAPAPASCDKPAYMVAFDTDDAPPAGASAPTGIRQVMMQSVDRKLAHLVAEGVPDLTYERNTEWRDVIITKWDCTDDLEAFWSSTAATTVRTPTPDGHRIFAVGVFDTAPFEDGGVKADLQPPACAAPMLLIGFNTVTDPAKYAIYREALTNSRLPFRHGFRRIFAGAPKKVLAGQWPDNTTVTLSSWPCREAFESFHQADSYHKAIYPLRVGNARYRLVGYSNGRHHWPLRTPN